MKEHTRTTDTSATLRRSQNPTKHIVFWICYLHLNKVKSAVWITDQWVWWGMIAIPEKHLYTIYLKNKQKKKPHTPLNTPFPWSLSKLSCRYHLALHMLSSDRLLIFIRHRSSCCALLNPFLSSILSLCACKHIQVTGGGVNSGYWRRTIAFISTKLQTHHPFIHLFQALLRLHFKWSPTSLHVVSHLEKGGGEFFFFF